MNAESEVVFASTHNCGMSLVKNQHKQELVRRGFRELHYDLSDPLVDMGPF